MYLNLARCFQGSHWQRSAGFISLVLFVTSGVFAGDKLPLPFDQRQILLVKSASNETPDDATMAQIMDVFVRRGRVRWVTQEGGESQIVPVVVPDDFAWHSAPAVRKLGLRYKSDGIVHLSSEGAKIDLRWYATLDGLPLFFENLKVPNAGKDEHWKDIRKERIQSWINEIWSRIPGEGFIVGREGGKVTLEGAPQAGALKGSRLQSIRIVKVERHPVLKTLMNIESSETGELQIDDLGEAVSEADILYEAEIDPVEVGDRYVVKMAGGNSDRNMPAPSLNKGTKKAAPSEPKKNEVQKVSFFGNTKKMMDLSASLTLGPITHTEAFSTTNTYNLKTAAYNPGLELEGLLYFTKAWIMGANVSMTFGNFKTVEATYAVSSLDSGLSSYFIYGGYRFLFLKQLASPAELRLLVGYRSWSLSMQSLGTNIAPSAKSYSGLDVGVHVGFPLYQKAGAYFHGGRLFGASLSEKPSTSGDAPSSSYWRFGGAVTYALDQRSEFKVGANFESATTTFDGQGQRTTKSLSTKILRKYALFGYTYSY